MPNNNGVPSLRPPQGAPVLTQQNSLQQGLVQVVLPIGGTMVAFTPVQQFDPNANFVWVQSVHITGSGTETAPANAFACMVIADGGGGSGAFTAGALGGGGGGGGRALKKFFPVAAGDTCPWAVGTGGAAQASTPATGNNGTSSTANAGATATGGFATALASVLTGGLGSKGGLTVGGGGGSGTNGDVNTTGGTGTTNTGGKGGDAGSGAVGGHNDSGAGPAAGAAPGAGGGMSDAALSGLPSGAGADGQVVFIYKVANPSPQSLMAVGVPTLNGVGTQWGAQQGYVYNGSTMGHVLKGAALAQNSEATLMCFCMPTNTASTGTSGAGVNIYGFQADANTLFGEITIGQDGSVANAIGIFIDNDADSTFQGVSATNNNWKNNVPAVVIGRTSKALNRTECWVSGVPSSANTTQVAQTGTFSFERTVVGVNDTGADTYHTDYAGTIFLCAAWNRALTAWEIQAVSANPYLVLGALPSNIWSGMQAPVDATLPLSCFDDLAVYGDWDAESYDSSDAQLSRPPTDRFDETGQTTGQGIYVDPTWIIDEDEWTPDWAQAPPTDQFDETGQTTGWTSNNDWTDEDEPLADDWLVAAPTQDDEYVSNEFADVWDDDEPVTDGWLQVVSTDQFDETGQTTGQVSNNDWVDEDEPLADDIWLGPLADAPVVSDVSIFLPSNNDWVDEDEPLDQDGGWLQQVPTDQFDETGQTTGAASFADIWDDDEPLIDDWQRSPPDQDDEFDEGIQVFDTATPDDDDEPVTDGTFGQPPDQDDEYGDSLSNNDWTDEDEPVTDGWAQVVPTDQFDETGQTTGQASNNDWTDEDEPIADGWQFAPSDDFPSDATIVAACFPDDAGFYGDEEPLADGWLSLPDADPAPQDNSYVSRELGNDPVVNEDDVPIEFALGSPFDDFVAPPVPPAPPSSGQLNFGLGGSVPGFGERPGRRLPEVLDESKRLRRLRLLELRRKREQERRKRILVAMIHALGLLDDEGD